MEDKALITDFLQNHPFLRKMAGFLAITGATSSLTSCSEENIPLDTPAPHTAPQEESWKSIFIFNENVPPDIKSLFERTFEEFERLEGREYFDAIRPQLNPGAKVEVALYDTSLISIPSEGNAIFYYDRAYNREGYLSETTQELEQFSFEGTVYHELEHLRRPEPLQWYKDSLQLISEMDDFIGNINEFLIENDFNNLNIESGGIIDMILEKNSQTPKPILNPTPEELHKIQAYHAVIEYLSHDSRLEDFRELKERHEELTRTIENYEQAAVGDTNAFIQKHFAPDYARGDYSETDRLPKNKKTDEMPSFLNGTLERVTSSEDITLGQAHEH